MSAMRVPRTFAFLDLSGFTNYTAAYGDDAAGRILSTFRTLAREIASERGVRIAKWLGDGCMAVAVDQQAAIEFVTDLERRASRVCAPLTMRAGIATGYALLFEGDDYIGSAVNMAARLCDHAENFEVLIPTMHLERLPEGVSAEPYGEVELPGFPGTIDLVRLTGAPIAVERHDTGELWTRSPFV
jgi:class 3 adenylate cyclase